MRLRSEVADPAPNSQKCMMAKESSGSDPDDLTIPELHWSRLVAKVMRKVDIQDLGRKHRTRAVVQNREGWEVLDDGSMEVTREKRQR